MARKTTEQADRDRGRRDGFDGREPRGEAHDYREGYAEGEKQREEARGRLDETCRRMKVYEQFA